MNMNKKTMDEQGTFVDYYKILECDRNATNEELKSSYKRLLLSTHPDKVVNQNDDKFCLIQNAWSVLKDEQSRKLYDATLVCHEHSELLLYDTIKLSEMEFSPSEGVYSYSCRCGGTYLVDSSECSVDSIIIGCNECSFSVQVNKPS